VTISPLIINFVLFMAENKFEIRISKSETNWLSWYPCSAWERELRGGDKPARCHGPSEACPCIHHSSHTLHGQASLGPWAPWLARAFIHLSIPGPAVMLVPMPRHGQALLGPWHPGLPVHYHLISSITNGPLLPSSYHAALDHFHSEADDTNPRRTGLL